jgi:hypothetical protein
MLPPWSGDLTDVRVTDGFLGDNHEKASSQRPRFKTIDVGFYRRRGTVADPGFGSVQHPDTNTNSSFRLKAAA